MPGIRATMYVIAVNDLRRSAAFYADALGFTVHEIGDDGWRMFTRDSCRIMAGHCPDATPPAALGDHSYFAYLTVDDADGLYAEIAPRIEPAGGAILKPPRDEVWGMREFDIRTVDGHRIMVGQDIAKSA